MRGWLVLSAGLALTAGIAGWLWRESRPSNAAVPRPAPASVRQGLQPAPSRVAERPPVPVLERSSVPAASVPAPLPSEAEVGDEREIGEDLTPAERQAEDRAQQRELQAQFERRFNAQAVDRAWGRATEAKLNEALAAADLPGARVQLTNVDCRSDICKSTLTYDSVRPSPEFMLRFIMKAAVGLENHFAYGDGQTTMYSLRRDDAATPEE